jgi:membrane protein implicated in regulation of membrane protease activity
MSWADFYMVCFVVGLLLSVLSLVLGDIHLHVHLPFHLHFGGLHIGGPDVGHGVAGPHAAGGQLPAFNLATVTAFLAWFGGTGYLLTRHSSLYGMTALVISMLGGLAGASIIFMAISKVILRHEADVEYETADMVGLLGRITSTVNQGGTGEIVYVQGGTRHSCGARSETGAAIPKGIEVVVTRYEKGIAYVRPWDEFNDSAVSSLASDDRGNS